jgi:hypothetical protein
MVAPSRYDGINSVKRNSAKGPLRVRLGIARDEHNGSASPEQLTRGETLDEVSVGANSGLMRRSKLPQNYTFCLVADAFC